MRGSRSTDEQIIGVLREADAGASTSDLCRRHGISPAGVQLPAFVEPLSIWEGVLRSTNPASLLRGGEERLLDVGEPVGVYVHAFFFDLSRDDSEA